MYTDLYCKPSKCIGQSPCLFEHYFVWIMQLFDQNKLIRSRWLNKSAYIELTSVRLLCYAQIWINAQDNLRDGGSVGRLHDDSLARYVRRSCQRIWQGAVLRSVPPWLERGILVRQVPYDVSLRRAVRLSSGCHHGVLLGNRIHAVASLHSGCVQCHHCHRRHGRAPAQLTTQGKVATQQLVVVVRSNWSQCVWST